MRGEQVRYWLHIIYDVLKGNRGKSLYVLGYPRSGTNWLTNLISEYTSTPISKPWLHTLPRFRNYVFHVHRFINFNSVISRTVYIVRDGRDVTVSLYFKLVSDPGKSRMREAAELHLNNEMTQDNVVENLPKFISYLEMNRIASIDYKQHIEQALRRKYFIIKYEELREGTDETLRSILEHLLNEEIEYPRIKNAVSRHSFLAKSGRQPGEEDNKAQNRKGISGDWKNYFSPEASKAFDIYAGELLIQLGYEMDHSWVNHIR